MKPILIAALFSSLLFGAPEASAGPGQDTDASSNVILQRFLEATQNHEEAGRGVSMQVDINASVPKLKEHGRLRALRKISRVGQITYQLLGFQGDNTVKNQVIARYLQAEKQGQGDQSLSISPANYKFKFKGRQKTEAGNEAYVFQLSPRQKKVGLFKGDLWLDMATYLPVLEKGRLVKNPSIFFRRVDFQRDFAIQNGAAIPAHMSSTIDTRLIGKVLLNIDYSNYVQDCDQPGDPTQRSAGSESATN